jgi:hypothetical protein
MVASGIKLDEVEVGRGKILTLLPRVEEVVPGQLRLVEAKESALVLDVGGQSLTMNWAEGQTFHTQTGLDAKMLSRMSPTLRNQAFMELVGNLRGPMRFKVRDETIVGFLKDQQEYPNYQRFLDRAISEVKPLGIGNIVFSRDKVGFGLVTNSVQAPPTKRDDVIHEGLYFSFNGAPTVEPYNFRMVCSNGMLGIRRLGQAWVLSDDTFSGTITAALETTKRCVTAFTELTTRPIANPGGLVGHLSKIRVLNAQQVQKIVEQVASLGTEATEFDLVNLITAQQHTNENSLSWLEAGGRTLEHLHTQHCSHCGTAV